MWKQLEEQLDCKKLTARDLAKATGIDESLISKWRRGIQKPQIDNLIVLAEYLEVTVDELIR